LHRGESRIATRALTAKYGNRFRLFRVVTLVGAPRKYGGRGIGLEIALDEHPTRSR
jgi:hypothetical protein